MRLSSALWPLLAMSVAAAFQPAARAQLIIPKDVRHPDYEVHPPWVNRANFGNQLRDAEASAAGETGDQWAFYANDNRHDSTPDHWAYAVLPAWIQFKMPEIRPVQEIRIWFPPDAGPRTYTLMVEGASFGKDWTTLVPEREYTPPLTMDPLILILPKVVQIRYLKVTVTGNSNSKAGEGARIWQVEAFAHRLSPILNGTVGGLPVRYTGAPVLEGAVGSIYQRYDGDTVPIADAPAAWTATGWRGERVNGQFVIWSDGEREQLRASVSPLTGPGGALLPAGAARTYFVRHVLAAGKYTGDILDDSSELYMEPGTYRPIWLRIDVPRDAAPGRYTGTLTVRADDGGEKRFPLTLDVLAATLPDPAHWTFHMDIWQHPLAIAAWHDVEPWSAAHFQVMAPYMRMLADAGQKVITTTIVDRPWNRRDYIDYRSMVEHIREPDGSWKFDYSVFDKYVEYAMSFGINQQINCVSLLTWGYMYAYTDAATGAEITINAAPESAAYADYWRPFLRDFQRHLAAKGWLDRTCITMDEPSPDAVRIMARLVKANAPRLRLCLAGNEPASNFSDIDLKDFTIILYQANSESKADIAQRHSERRTTTFYPCMDPLRPNDFTDSPPAEGVWIGYYAFGRGFDGIQRWAFTNWPRDPFRDTGYSPVLGQHVLPPGDSFLVYPGPLSSIRWEMLRAGAVEYEKLLWLRAHHGGTLPAGLRERLDTDFGDPGAPGTDAQERAHVEAMQAAINAAADSP